MVQTLKKKIEEFIAKSYGAYTLTTNKQIEELAVKLDTDFGSIALDEMKLSRLEHIIENKLTTDFDMFYDKLGDFKLAELYMNLANEMDIKLEDMLKKINKDIIVYEMTFNKFIEHKIIVDKIFGEIDIKDLVYFDYETVWEDIFQDDHYIKWL
ncbi:MAG: hypothetical protein PHQ70_07980 [Arcobacter sp.]|uniref:hypothetical protein n=1 Tax=Arcobacter sp. TaxID=1872629 RepID=UPI00258B0A56|nr:hypothetical protein [Arcobacter sp.]MDD3008788.1 hypothetical protein [Arcobacter sp.]